MCTGGRLMSFFGIESEEFFLMEVSGRALMVLILGGALRGGGGEGVGKGARARARLARARAGLREQCGRGRGACPRQWLE